MSIFSKFFKKRQQPSLSDEFNVVLITKNELSEEQKDAIITIVKAGIEQETELSTISLAIFASTEISSPVILNRIKNGVEVIIY